MDTKNDAFGELNVSEIKVAQTRFIYLKVIFLPTIFFIAFLLGYLGYIKFSVSLHTIIMISLIYALCLVFARNSAEIGCSYFEQNLGNFKRDLKKYIIKNILVIGNEKKSNASFDDFVKEQSKYVRNENYASIGAGIFPMLGILGTFISIAITMPDFKSNELEAEISALLSGVGTAFYVSIYGIFLALWWIFFEKHGISKFQKLITRLQNETSAFFWTKEDIVQRYLSESLSHFDKIGVVFDYVSNEEFFNRLNQSVEHRFDIFKSILANEEKSVRLSSEHVKQTTEILLKSKRDQKDTIQIYNEILNVLNSFNSNLKETQLRFSEQYTRLQGICEYKLDRVEKVVSTFENTLSLFNKSLGEFGLNLIKEQKLALEGFRAALFEGMNSFKEIMNESSAEIYDKNSEKMISEYKKNVGKLDKEVNEVLDKINKLDSENTDEDR